MSGGPGPPPGGRSSTPGGWSPLHFRPNTPYAPSPPPRMGSPAAAMFGNRLPYGMPCPRPRWPTPMSPVPVPPPPHAFSPPPPGPKPFRRPLHPPSPAPVRCVSPIDTPYFKGIQPYSPDHFRGIQTYSPDHFRGAPQTPDNFRGPQYTPDNFRGAPQTPDNFRGSQYTPDNFRGSQFTPDNFRGSQYTESPIAQPNRDFEYVGVPLEPPPLPQNYDPDEEEDIGPTTAEIIANQSQDYIDEKLAEYQATIYLLQGNKTVDEELVPSYHTPEGKRAYEDTLNSVKNNFPQYVRELEGIADGANVPFYKLFLLHMDDIMPSPPDSNSANPQPVGCSSICVNQKDQEILGHTEDALDETLNHIYFVSAHIISEKPEGKWKAKEERFTSLCYAGHLPGYTMSYNHHGFIFSINTLSVKHPKPGKTPRMFITRALLGAENFVSAQEILRDRGCGAGNGCSINMTFLNQDGDRLFHNAEMAPSDKEESQLNIFTASPGECIIHTNKYLRIKIEETNEEMSKSSINRMATFKNNYSKPKSRSDVVKMLSDHTNIEYPVFRDGPDDFVKTVAVGIFDCKAKTWSIYSDNPQKNDPIVVLPLVLKGTK